MNELKLKENQERLNRLCSYLRQDPDNANLITDIFDLAMATGEFDLANDMVNRSLSQDANDPVWENRRAILFIARGRFTDAKSVLLDIAARGHMRSGVQYNLAYIAFCEHQYEQAASLSQELLSDTSVASDALCLLIRCLHHLRRFDDALNLVSQYSQIAANSPDTLGAASLVAVDHAQLVPARQFAERALAIKSDQADALLALGTLALGARQTNQALSLLHQVLHLRPEDGRVESAIGLAYMLTTEFSLAKDYLLKAVVHMPEHIGTHIVLGWCHLLTEQLMQARSAFEQALQLDRNFAESHGSLAVSLVMLGEITLAEEHIQKALKLDSACMSAQYANALLSGEARDQAKFKLLAERILRGKQLL